MTTMKRGGFATYNDNSQFANYYPSEIGILAYVHMFNNPDSDEQPRKSPLFVNEKDVVFRQILKNISEHDFLIVFAGKADSGAFEIIEIFTGELMKKHLYKIIFVLCPHELEEKIALLQKRNVPEHQYVSFNDDNYKQGKQCDEISFVQNSLKDLVARVC